MKKKYSLFTYILVIYIFITSIIGTIFVGFKICSLISNSLKSVSAESITGQYFSFQFPLTNAPSRYPYYWNVSNTSSLANLTVSNMAESYFEFNNSYIHINQLNYFRTRRLVSGSQIYVLCYRIYVNNSNVYDSTNGAIIYAYYNATTLEFIDCYASDNFESLFDVEFSQSWFESVVFVITSTGYNQYSSLGGFARTSFDFILVNSREPGGRLDTPVITIDNNLISWSDIEFANGYAVYYSLNGSDYNLYSVVYTNSYTCFNNGFFYIVALGDDVNYTDSLNSNIVQCTSFFNPISEYSSFNFYVLFSAIVDTTIFYIQSMLDYTIFGINFYTLFKLIITICLTILIIKFVNRKGD